MSNFTAENLVICVALVSMRKYLGISVFILLSLFSYPSVHDIFLIENIEQEKAPGVGGHGGSCQCPDGNVYQVGDNNNNCGSLACTNGHYRTDDCKNRNGLWSNRSVTCALGNCCQIFLADTILNFLIVFV